MRYLILILALFVTIQAHAFGRKPPAYQKPAQFSGFSTLEENGERALAEIEARRWYRKGSVPLSSASDAVRAPFEQTLELRVFGSNLEIDSETLEISTWRKTPFSTVTGATGLVVKEQVSESNGAVEVLLGVDPASAKIRLAYANPAAFEAETLEALPPEARGFNSGLPEQFEFLVLSWNPAAPDSLLVKAYVDGNVAPVEIRYEAEPQDSSILLCKSPGFDTPELYWVRAPLKEDAAIRFYTLTGGGFFQYRERCWNREAHMLAMYEYPACVLVLSEARLLVDLQREIGTYYFEADFAPVGLNRSSLICIQR